MFVLGLLKSKTTFTCSTAALYTSLITFRCDTLTYRYSKGRPIVLQYGIQFPILTIFSLNLIICFGPPEVKIDFQSFYHEEKDHPNVDLVFQRSLHHQPRDGRPSLHKIPSQHISYHQPLGLTTLELSTP